MARVLVADDHPLLRKGLKQLLDAEPDLELAGEAEDSEQVLEKVQRDCWDVLVLDLTMPGRAGLEVLQEIRRVRPNLPVLVLSMHAEERFAVRAIKAGANGYVSKANGAAEVVTAIRKVLTGRKYVSATLAEALAGALDGDGQRPLHETLSDREFQVMCKIACGRTVSQIAAEISLSVKTISTYRSRVLEKMHMRSNAELTRYAIQEGLVD
ncbi:MAG TPA: response regulator transcription factor [Bryobacteraceae bacterium]|nr:response regulator transcription factor [Bryobacteraceae bacterium]